MNKRIEELENQIADLQAEVTRLKSYEKPTSYELYWFIQSTGQVRHTYNTPENYKNAKRIEMGNYFRSKADADFWAKKIKYENMLRNYIAERDNLIDWNDASRNKYCIAYCIAYNTEEEYVYVCNASYPRQGVIYTNSEDVLQEAIEYIGEENIKKYIFGVGVNK